MKGMRAALDRYERGINRRYPSTFVRLASTGDSVTETLAAVDTP